MLIELAVQRGKLEQVKEAVRGLGDVTVVDEYPREPTYWPALRIDFSWHNLDFVVKALHEAFRPFTA